VKIGLVKRKVKKRKMVRKYLPRRMLSKRNSRCKKRFRVGFLVQKQKNNNVRSERGGSSTGKSPKKRVQIPKGYPGRRGQDAEATSDMQTESQTSYRATGKPSSGKGKKKKITGVQRARAKIHTIIIGEGAPFGSPPSTWWNRRSLGGKGKKRKIRLGRYGTGEKKARGVVPQLLPTMRYRHHCLTRRREQGSMKR